MDSSDLHQRLQTLIGERFFYQKQEWLLLDILVSEDLLVLCRHGDCEKKKLQTNQYGQPSRRAQVTITLPISDPSDAGFSEEALEFLKGKL